MSNRVDKKSFFALLLLCNRFPKIVLPVFQSFSLICASFNCIGRRFLVYSVHNQSSAQYFALNKIRTTTNKVKLRKHVYLVSATLWLEVRHIDFCKKSEYVGRIQQKTCSFMGAAITVIHLKYHVTILSTIAFASCDFVDLAVDVLAF